MADDLTHLLAAAEAGDRRAADEILPRVYDELRRLAAARLAHEPPGQTLDPTALVHEAYLRLLPPGPSVEPRRWDGAGHFFAAAARAMRRILIESARRRTALKRGGGRERVSLDADRTAAPLPDEELVALDAALVRFAEVDPLKAKLVELRYFAGLSADRAAEILGIAPSTADRHWAFARAWLHRALRADG